MKLASLRTRQGGSVFTMPQIVVSEFAEANVVSATIAAMKGGHCERLQSHTLQRDA